MADDNKEVYYTAQISAKDMEALIVIRNYFRHKEELNPLAVLVLDRIIKREEPNND